MKYISLMKMKLFKTERLSIQLSICVKINLKTNQKDCFHHRKVPHLEIKVKLIKKKRVVRVQRFQKIYKES